MWQKVELPKNVVFEPNFIGEATNALRLKNCYMDDDGNIRSLLPPEMRGTGLQMTTAPSLSNPIFAIRKYSPPNHPDIIVIASKSGIDINKKGGSLQSVVATGAKRVTFHPVPLSSADFALLLATDGYFTVSGIQTPLALWFVKNGQAYLRPLQMPPPTLPPLLLASSSHRKKIVEYRYMIAHYDSVSGVESAPSPPVSAYVNPETEEYETGDDKHYRPMLFGVETPPSWADKIRVYRLTEAVAQYMLIGEVTIPNTNRWKWDFTDDKDISYVSTTYPNFSTYVATTPTDVCYQADRLYIADKNIVYFSKVNQPFSLSAFYTGNPLDGYYVQLDENVRRLYAWGSHVLALCENKWYRIIEGETHYVLRVDLPTPAIFAEKVRDLLIIGNRNGLYLVKGDEQVQQIPVNWRYLYDYDFRRDMQNVVVRLISGRYLDVCLPSYTSMEYDRNGMEYLRIDLFTGAISGLHTIDTFWGWNSA